MPLGLSVLVVGGVVLALTWPAVNVPRVVLFPLNLVALGFTATTAGAAPESRATGRVFLGLAVALAIVAAFRLRWSVVALLAALAARAWSAAAPFTTKAVYFAALAIVVIVSELVARRLPPDAPPEPHRPLLKGAAIAAVVASWILALPLFATPLTTPMEPRFAARIEQLREHAPTGGLVWPHPSEALLWEDNETFPAFDREDAIYLTGAPRALVRLPGPWLSQKLSLHRDVAVLRSFKDPSELRSLSAAAQAAVASLKDVLPLLHPGARESDIATKLERRFTGHGCTELSFPPVVATGAHAAEPHYFKREGTLAAATLS